MLGFLAEDATGFAKVCHMLPGIPNGSGTDPELPFHNPIVIPHPSYPFTPGVIMMQAGDLRRSGARLAAYAEVRLRSISMA